MQGTNIDIPTCRSQASLAAAGKTTLAGGFRRGPHRVAADSQTELGVFQTDFIPYIWQGISVLSEGEKAWSSRMAAERSAKRSEMKIHIKQKCEPGDFRFPGLPLLCNQSERVLGISCSD